MGFRVRVLTPWLYICDCGLLNPGDSVPLWVDGIIPARGLFCRVACVMLLKQNLPPKLGKTPING